MSWILWVLVILAIIIILAIAFQGNNPGRSHPDIPVEQTINVTVVPKTTQHPFYQQGSSLGYRMNGTQGATLYLNRGAPYLFNINNPQHPMYFTMSTIGDNNAVDRLPDSPEPFGTPVVVTFGNNYPDHFYYQCSIYPQMGGVIFLK